MARRRFDPLVMFDIPATGGGQVIAPPGVDLFVNTANGAAGRSGLSWDTALSTMAEAFSRLSTPKFFTAGHSSNARIFVAGAIREQIVAPLGVYGVKIIGAAAGRPRHTTSSGVVLAGNGVDWREAAVAGDAPLLELREQGWEIHNILMVPQSGYASVKLHCEETATYPDASHFIARNMRFISGGTRVGYGIEDYGGAAHIGVYDCEFTLLEFGYNPTNVSIRGPQDQVWRGNIFRGNKHDVVGNYARSLFDSNQFLTVYHATTHPNTLNLAYTGGDGGNRVWNNAFADAAADVTIANGYKPGTGDVWRNKVSNTAADIVTVPS